MKFQCDQCKSILNSDSVTDGMKVDCPVCCAEIVCHPFTVQSKRNSISPGIASKSDENAQRNTRQERPLGCNGKKSAFWSFLSGVFSKHSSREMESCFAIGTETSTPNIQDVNPVPRPWIFARLMAVSLGLYLVLLFVWEVWENTTLLPALMIVGSFAIPIPTLILFWELNVWRNISIYVVAKLMLVGGIVSFFITHLLIAIVPLTSIILPDWGDLLGASAAGPLEETAKVLAMVFFVRATKYRYKMNGLLLGAAVGTGFAAFESVGYAFNFLVEGDVNDMLAVIGLRSVFSPFMHVVWSAIAGCALWQILDGQEFKWREWRLLCDEKFIKPFLIPVILHMLWNSDLQLPYCGTQIVIGCVAWVVCFRRIREGLHEITIEQGAAKNGGES